MQSLRGQLLIAAPPLDDPNFARTVILVAHHDEDGAMGVILNRPGDQLVGDAVPELADVVPDEEPVYVGGPVQPDGVMVLAEFEDPEAAALPVLSGLGFVALGTRGEHVSGDTRRARAFAGHAGWGPGQLEDELDEEAWITAAFVPEDAFTAEPQGLWSEVLTRKGGPYALVATMPLDPSLN